MTPKESQRERDTHFLSRAEGGTSEDTERKPASEWNSPTSEGRPEGGGGASEDSKSKPMSERYLLSDEGRGRDKWLVRTRKESQRAKGTHILLSAEGATSQDIKRKASERGALTLCQAQGEG
jgi:hypothetical protein